MKTKKLRIKGPGIGVRGRVKIQVLQAGKVVEDRPWQDNLILDQGLNKFATVTIEKCMRYCCAGSGTTPTQTVSGATTVSQTGSTVTASASLFSASDVGRVLKTDAGQVRTITSYSSGTSVGVAESGDFSASPCTIYRVEQTSLDTEVKRTGTCLTNANGQENDTINKVIKNYRTFDFPAESSNQNYSEIGFSNISTAGSNLYARILLSGAVSVLGPQGGAPGQQLRVFYEQFIQIDEGTSTAGTFNVTGWPVSYGVSSITSTSSNFTVTTNAPHHYVAGHDIIISGCTVSAYNGTWTIASVTSTTFTVTSTINPGNASDGSVTNVQTGTYIHNKPNFDGPELNGNEDASSFEGDSEPMTTTYVGRIASGFTLPVYNAGGPSSSGGVLSTEVGSYSNGNFFREFTVSFTIAQNNGAWFGVRIGGGDVWTFRFNSVQYKANTHTLTLNFKKRWGRIL